MGEKIKDKKSYQAHNAEYEGKSDLDWCKQRFADYEKEGHFATLGFEEEILAHPNVRKMHIDIGSGAGWLLVKTAPYFEEVIGIEPSMAAIDMAKYFTANFPNVRHLNCGMTEGMRSLALKDPLFFTTSTVFSHIQDYDVAEFLELLNTAPRGSILFFREPYGKNRQQHLWHIRSKEWWARQLPCWELTFKGYTGNGYENGIAGICVGKEHVKNKYVMSFLQNVAWVISGVPSRLKYLLKNILLSK